MAALASCANLAGRRFNIATQDIDLYMFIVARDSVCDGLFLTLLRSRGCVGAGKRYCRGPAGV
jgi:hypothetical protein